MTDQTVLRTYGHWVRPHLKGLFGLSLAANVAMGVGAVAIIIATAVKGFSGGLVAIVASVVVIAPLALRTRDGRTLYERWWLFRAKRRDVKAGRAVLSQGPAGMVPDGKCRLPGLLAQSELFEAVDALGSPFGVVYVPSTGHYSVVIEGAAIGMDMIDQPVIDEHVANWGAWLAMLGQQNSDISGAQVVIETAPDPGVRFRRELDSRRSKRSSNYAVTVAEEVKQTYPAGSAQISTRISLTFSSRAVDGGRNRRPRAEMVTRIGNGLPGFIGQLKLSGAGHAPVALRAADIVDSTRVAFDPHVAQDVEEARAEGGTGLTWEEAGPVFHDDRDPLVYRHDRALSMCWQMLEPPRSVVYSSVLRQLLAPHRDVARKRISLLYRPMSHEQSAKTAETGVQNATFVLNNNKKVNARDHLSLRHAQQTANEEATGAGMVRFGVIITATVLEASLLPQAAEAVKQLRASARLKLRPAGAVQATTFSAGLPLGLVLPEHMMVAPELKDAL